MQNVPAYIFTLLSKKGKTAKQAAAAKGAVEGVLAHFTNAAPPLHPSYNPPTPPRSAPSFAPHTHTPHDRHAPYHNTTASPSSHLYNPSNGSQQHQLLPESIVPSSSAYSHLDPPPPPPSFPHTFPHAQHFAYSPSSSFSPHTPPQAPRHPRPPHPSTSVSSPPPPPALHYSPGLFGGVPSDSTHHFPTYPPPVSGAFLQIKHGAPPPSTYYNAPLPPHSNSRVAYADTAPCSAGATFYGAAPFAPGSTLSHLLHSSTPAPALSAEPSSNSMGSWGGGEGGWDGVSTSVNTSTNYPSSTPASTSNEGNAMFGVNGSSCGWVSVQDAAPHPEPASGRRAGGAPTAAGWLSAPPFSYSSAPTASLSSPAMGSGLNLGRGMESVYEASAAYF